MFEPFRSSRCFSCEYDKNNAVSITFHRRLWHEWGVWPKSNTMPTYFSRFRRNWPGRGGPGCCGLAGPPKKNRLCNKRPGGRESRARISLLAYGKQADGGEGREARRKTEGKCLWAKGRRTLQARLSWRESLNPIPVGPRLLLHYFFSKCFASCSSA